MKEMIQKINRTAQENWEKAQGMLEMLNMMSGTEFGWLNKRVVRFNNPKVGYSGGCHDAWAEME